MKKLLLFSLLSGSAVMFSMEENNYKDESVYQGITIFGGHYIRDYSDKVKSNTLEKNFFQKKSKEQLKLFLQTASYDQINDYKKLLIKKRNIFRKGLSFWDDCNDVVLDDKIEAANRLEEAQENIVYYTELIAKNPKWDYQTRKDTLKIINHIIHDEIPNMNNWMLELEKKAKIIELAKKIDEEFVEEIVKNKRLVNILKRTFSLPDLRNLTTKDLK
jgi:hypothetical protein